MADAPTPKQFAEWCERHDMNPVHHKEAFEDAASLYFLQPQPPAAPLTPDAETVGLIARARLAMLCAIDWEKTKSGRPPSVVS